jgi:hypothetical protein
MKKIPAFLFSFLLPVVVFAQSLSEIKNINGLSTRLLAIGDIVIYLFVSVAVVYIIWHVVQYFIKPSKDSRKDAGMNILWGIVGLFIIVSIWGLVNILINTFYTDANIPRDRFPNANFVNSGNNVVIPTQNINPYSNQGVD